MHSRPNYAAEIGFRMPPAAAFLLEPQIKEETLLHHHRGRPFKLLERRGPNATIRDDGGESRALKAALGRPAEKVLSIL